MTKVRSFKNRCIAKTLSKKSHRCAGKITKKDNPENLSYCRVHLAKHKVDNLDKQNIEKVDKVDNSDNIEKVDKVDNSDNVEVGQCFICREECNRSSQACGVHLSKNKVDSDNVEAGQCSICREECNRLSQTCGSCARKLSMYGPFALRIFRY